MIVTNIKPIETIYKGYRFRSRLEARWAVFFDAAGIEYQYESEGYDLGDGFYYLPDFYIPDWDIFVEIKPASEYGYNEKADRLAQLSEKIVILCAGEPYCDGEDIYAYKSAVFYPDGETWFTDANDYPLVFEDCRRCDGFVLESPGYGQLYVGIHAEHCTERHGIFTERILQAYSASRQARFEHGEKPENKPTKSNSINLRELADRLKVCGSSFQKTGDDG